MRYTLDWQTAPLPIQSPMLASNWVGRWVPSVALRWLSEFSELYEHWWRYILRDWYKDNPLMQFLQTNVNYKPKAYIDNPLQKNQRRK